MQRAGGEHARPGVVERASKFLARERTGCICKMREAGNLRERRSECGAIRRGDRFDEAD